MSRHTRREARSRTRSRIAVILTGAALLSWAGPGANAFWTATSYGGSATASADAVGAGAKPTAAVSGGNVMLAWNATTTLAGRAATGYTVARYASASGGTKVAAGGTCSGTVTAGLGCTDQGVLTGAWYYTVTPVLGQWQGAESVRSSGAAVDTTPPAAPTVTAPVYVNSTTVTSVPVSGTTEAGASIALTVADSGSVHSVTATATTNESGAWSTVVNLSSFNDGPLTYRAVATDTAGNASSPGTASSTKNVTVPRVTAVALADAGTTGKNGSTKGKADPGDNVTIQFSEPLDASTICGSWASAAAGTLSGDNQVTVTISAANVLSVDVASAACPTFRFGTVALNGAYYGSGALTYQGAGTSASTLSWNPSSPTPTLTITLGALASGSPATANTTAAAPSYTPAGGMSDKEGNALAVTPVYGSITRF